MTYWIVVGLPENYIIASKRGFDMFGFKSTRRRESSEMRPGDKLVFYLVGVKKFAGIATVTSESYEEHNKVFKSEKKPNEDFPYRVKTKADITLSEEQWLNVPDFVPLLEKTRMGAMKSWGMAFQGNLHKISEHDYKIIESAMRKRKSAGASRRGTSSAKSAATTTATGKTRSVSSGKETAVARTQLARKRATPARKPAARPRSTPAGRQRTRRNVDAAISNRNPKR
jgi:predicted RNA-binding protein